MKVGDTILMYARSDTHVKEVFPSVVLGEFNVNELLEDTTPLFTAPPQMGDEVFPFRFKLKPVKIYKEPIEIKPLIPELLFVINRQCGLGISGRR